MEICPMIKISRLWLLAPTFGVGLYARADVSPPIKISVPREAIAPATAGQEFHGVFEVTVGERGTMEQVNLHGDGWTILEVNPRPPIELSAGEVATFSYRTVPRDAALPLTAIVVFDSQEVQRVITVSPARFAEKGKARPSSREPGSSGLRPGADPPPPSSDRSFGGSITLRFAGRIQYTRSDGAIMGADGVWFEIMDDDSPLFDETIYSGFTDGNGFFDVTTSWDDCDILGCDDPDIYLRYETDTDVVNVQSSDILEEDYSWDTENNTFGDYTGSFIDFGVQFPTNVGDHAALHIHTNITRAHGFVLTRDGTDVNEVDAQWPEGNNGAYYNSFFEEIHIGPDEQWVEGTIIHEWGHHFLETESVNVSADYCNGFCDGDTACSADTCGLLENGGHCLWCPETDHDAWNEGFPNWLGSVVIRNLPVDYPLAYPAPLQPVSISDGRYTLDSLSACCQDSANYVGQADITEGFLGALLRDVEDGDAMPDNHVMDPATDCSVDALGLGADEVLLVARVDQPTTPLDFINRFRARFPQYDQDFWSTVGNVSSVYLSLFPLPPPQVASQTQGCQAYTAGQALSLNVQGNGSRLQYQWRHDGMDVVNGLGAISGAKTPTLMINPVIVMDSGVYDCVVSTCDGTLSVVSAPIRVVVYAALGSGTNAASFGRNDLGQLGNGQMVLAGNPALPPTPLANLSSLVQVSGAGFLAMALRGDGTVWTWGDHPTDLQLGNPIPQQVSGLTGVTAVSAGGGGGAGHFLALKGDGTVWAWGSGSYGQLGQTTFASQPVPIQVPGLDCVVSIAAGAYTSYAVRSDGTVWSFGYNGHGELGRGTIGGWSNVVTPVPGITDAVAVAGGAYHALVLRGDGIALAWGRNTEGQLGDGNFVTRGLPVPVMNLSGINALRAGVFNSYAILAGGALRLWGSNNSAQLGNGTFNPSNIPLANATIPTVLDVAGGYSHSVFLRPDRTVWVTGANNSGELLAGGPGLIITPMQVPGLSNGSAVEAGDTQSFVLAPGVRPVIIQQPMSKTVNVGQSAQFSVAALGHATLTYRWTLNGTDLTNGNGVSGANAALLTINPVMGIHAGSLVVHVDNLFGGTMSVPATVTIQCAPTDANCDGVIDANDAGGFVDCVNGPAPGAPVPAMCMPMEFDAADADGDNDVDLRDFAALQRCFNPGGALVADCAP